MDKNSGLLKFLRLDGIVGSLSALVESKIELAKVELKEELAIIMSKMVVSLILLILGLFFLLFFSIAIAYYLGSRFDHTFWGFLVVSGVYLLLFVVLYFTRGRLKLQDYFIKIVEKTLHVK